MLRSFDPVRTREALHPVEKLTDWDLFQSLASELIYPSIQIFIVLKKPIRQHDPLQLL
jgi:hypothetical protein